MASAPHAITHTYPAALEGEAEHRWNLNIWRPAWFFEPTRRRLGTRCITPHSYQPLCYASLVAIKSAAEPVGNAWRASAYHVRLQRLQKSQEQRDATEDIVSGLFPRRSWLTWSDLVYRGNRLLANDNWVVQLYHEPALQLHIANNRCFSAVRLCTSLSIARFREAAKKSLGPSAKIL